MVPDIGQGALRRLLGGLSPFETVGMLASIGWLTVVIMVPTTHELYRERAPWKYALGMWSQLLHYLDYMPSAPHLFGTCSSVRQETTTA